MKNRKITFIFTHWQRSIDPFTVTVKGKTDRDILVELLGDYKMLEFPLSYNEGLLDLINLMCEKELTPEEIGEMFPKDYSIEDFIKEVHSNTEYTIHTEVE